MATYGFRVNLAWNGDKKRGEEMEKIVNAAFNYDSSDPDTVEDYKNDPDISPDIEKSLSLYREISSKLYNEPSLYSEFDTMYTFNEKVENIERPLRSMYFEWDDNQNTPYECFIPIFKMFPDLDFILQCQMDYVSLDNSQRYQVYTYHNGRKKTLYDEEFDDDRDAYDDRCQKGEDELLEWLNKNENDGDDDDKEKTIKKSKFKSSNLGKIDFDKKDGFAYITVFVKGADDSIMQKFIRSFEAQVDHDNFEFEDPTYKDLGWEIIEVDDSKLELMGPVSFWGCLQPLLDKTIADYPTLHFLIVLVFTDIEEDGRCGYFYTEYKNGKKTSLDSEDKIFEMNDYDQNENDTLLARTNELVNIVFPIVEKWLEYNSDASTPSTKPSPAAIVAAKKDPNDDDDDSDDDGWGGDDSDDDIGEISSEEAALQKVKTDGKALKYIPVDFITLKVCKTALELHPDALEAKEFFDIAMSLCQNEAFDTAIILLNRVIELYPKDFTYFHRAQCYNQIGQFDKAITDITRAIELNPKDAMYLDFRAYCYKEIGQFDKAIFDLTKAIELDPKEAMYLNTRAYRYKDLGQLDNAIADVNKALEIKPNAAGYLDSRAEMYEAKGDFQKAIADCKKAMELDPDKKTAKETLARCEAALKKAKPAPAGKAPAQQSGRTCSACGHALKPTSKFCPGCGVKQAAVCGNCGKQAREGAKFCAGCGNKL